jgi:hypothetical protein
MGLLSECDPGGDRAAAQLNQGGQMAVDMPAMEKCSVFRELESQSQLSSDNLVHAPGPFSDLMHISLTPKNL